MTNRCPIRIKEQVLVTDTLKAYQFECRPSNGLKSDIEAFTMGLVVNWVPEKADKWDSRVLLPRETLEDLEPWACLVFCVLVIRSRSIDSMLPSLLVELLSSDDEESPPPSPPPLESLCLNETCLGFECLESGVWVFLLGSMVSPSGSSPGLSSPRVFSGFGSGLGVPRDSLLDLLLLGVAGASSSFVYALKILLLF